MKAGSFITNPCRAPSLCLVLLPALLSIWLLSKWEAQGKQSSLEETERLQRLRLCCPTSRPEFGVLIPQSDVAKVQHCSFSLAWFPVAAPVVRLMLCGTSHSWVLQKDVSFCLGEEMERGSEGSKETELS